MEKVTIKNSGKVGIKQFSRFSPEGDIIDISIINSPNNISNLRVSQNEDPENPNFKAGHNGISSEKILEPPIILASPEITENPDIENGKILKTQTISQIALMDIPKNIEPF